MHRRQITSPLFLHRICFYSRVPALNKRVLLLRAGVRLPPGKQR